MELAQKVETALVSYLKSQNFPDAFSKDGILPGESDSKKAGVVILCICEDSDEEMPAFTGNFWLPVRVELRTPFGRDASGNTSLPGHQAAAAVLEDAIVINNLDAQLTASADAFTCLGLTDRQPIRSQDDGYHLSGYSFRVYACSSNLG